MPEVRPGPAFLRTWRNRAEARRPAASVTCDSLRFLFRQAPDSEVAFAIQPRCRSLGFQPGDEQPSACRREQTIGCSRCGLSLRRHGRSAIPPTVGGPGLGFDYEAILEDSRVKDSF